jgi:membrane-bound lytic murein transglycosylase B
MTRSHRGPSSVRSAVGTLVAATLLAGLVVVAAGAIARADLPQLDAGIPRVAYDAYRSASAQATTISADCAVDWTVLAGLGRVESRHGLFEPGHRIAAGGNVTPLIRGPQLDGTSGTISIPDTDGGAVDGDALWDRAMGPLQFIPTTWALLGRDGNGDGIADPDNLYDAALTAAAHLCVREPGDYAERSELRRALLAYNASGRYADQVLGWIDRYRSLPLDEVVAPA